MFGEIRTKRLNCGLKNFRDYIATFPQLNGHFRFVTLEGKPHGGACYDNDAFLDLVFGKRK